MQLKAPREFWGVPSQEVEGSPRLCWLWGQEDVSPLGNDELYHLQDPKGEQEPVCPRQSSSLQLMLPRGAPLPLGKAKLAFCLPWLQLSCADALWSHVLWRLSKHEMCP